MPKRKLKEFVVEVEVDGVWTFKSDHKNLDSAESNYEAIKKYPVCIKQNGVVIKTKDKEYEHAKN